MRIYIDTEFTNLQQPDLISIGLVADNGARFYGENLEYRKDKTSQFVKDVVIPLLDLDNPLVGFSEYVLAGKLKSWLSSFDEDLYICYDYFIDKNLLLQLVGSSLPNIVDYVDTRLELFDTYAYHCKQLNKPLNIETFVEIKNFFARIFEGYYQKFSDKRRHHALDDAYALWQAQDETLKYISALV